MCPNLGVSTVLNSQETAHVAWRHCDDQWCKATPNETIVSRPDFCSFTCGWAVYPDPLSTLQEEAESALGLSFGVSAQMIWCIEGIHFAQSSLKWKNVGFKGSIKSVIISESSLNSLIATKWRWLQSLLFFLSLVWYSISPYYTFAFLSFLEPCVILLSVYINRRVVVT